MVNSVSGLCHGQPLCADTYLTLNKCMKHIAHYKGLKSMCTNLLVKILSTMAFKQYYSRQLTVYVAIYSRTSHSHSFTVRLTVSGLISLYHSIYLEHNHYITCTDSAHGSSAMYRQR